MSEFSVELRDIVKKFPTPEGGEVFAINNVSMQIKNGEFFSMLGPSGCGKTTSLRTIAGFEWPTSGEIYIEGEPMGHRPPYLRPVNTVFQSYALFPHMSVAQNIAFGLEMEKIPKNEIKRRVAEVLEMVKLTGMERRSPAQLSGGQRQRVALARSLVKRPKVLLLDEPLGALDLKLRKEMQLELKALQQEVGITFVYVTHDQEEALTMSDRIAIMQGGNVLQVGTPVEIYERPNCRFVADFIGETNFLEGEVRVVEENRVTVHIPVLKTDIIGTKAEPLSIGEQVVVSLRPEKTRIIENKVNMENCFQGTVLNTAYIGSDTRVFVDLGGVSLRIWEQNKISTLDPEAYYERNEQVWVVVMPENALVLHAG